MVLYGFSMVFYGFIVEPQPHDRPSCLMQCPDLAPLEDVDEDGNSASFPHLSGASRKTSEGYVVAFGHF